MTGITDPAEPYFKSGLWGWASSAWLKLVATAGGLLKVQLGGQDADIEITQTTPADLIPGVCGWDGSAWRKLPIVWGYSDRYAEGKLTITTGATENQAFTTVPSGEVWVVTLYGAFDASGAHPNAVYLQYYDGASMLFIKPAPSLAASTPIELQTPLILKAGSYLNTQWITATAGHYLRSYALGYKMKVNQ